MIEGKRRGNCSDPGVEEFPQSEVNLYDGLVRYFPMDILYKRRLT